MAHFENAIDFVLEHEGGYVNHPSDPGGETNFGICKRSYPKIDIKKLTRGAAVEIYRKDYWEKSGADKLDDALALVHFDTAVNTGLACADSLLAASQSDVHDYLLRRIGYYIAISRMDPKLKTFFAGWVNRVMDCYNEVS